MLEGAAEDFAAAGDDDRKLRRARAELHAAALTYAWEGYGRSLGGVVQRQMRHLQEIRKLMPMLFETFDDEIGILEPVERAQIAFHAFQRSEDLAGEWPADGAPDCEAEGDGIRCMMFRGHKTRHRGWNGGALVSWD